MDKTRPEGDRFIIRSHSDPEQLQNVGLVDYVCH